MYYLLQRNIPSQFGILFSIHQIKAPVTPAHHLLPVMFLWDAVGLEVLLDSDLEFTKYYCDRYYPSTAIGEFG